MLALISCFKHEDFLVGSAQKNLIEEVFVCSCTLAGSVEEVDIALKGSEGKEDEGVFQPAESANILSISNVKLRP